MFSENIFRYHILVFRMFGLWPSEKSGWLYNCWSKIFVVVVAIGFPLSQLACVLFVGSVDEIVEHLVLSSTCVTASIKGIIVLIQKRKLVKLLEIINVMDERASIGKREYKEIFDPIMKRSRQLGLMFIGAYGTAWSILALEVIFASVEKRGKSWSSTSLYPSEYLHKPSIYWGCLIYQATSNLILCAVDAAVDTYPPIVLNVLIGHIDVLKAQLKGFAAEDRIKNDREQIQSLIRFCEHYKNILRCSIAPAR